MSTTRITLPQLATDYKEFVEHLAIRWVTAGLPPEWIWEGERLPEPISYLYADYLHHIGTLLLTTQDLEQTQLIVTGVLDQAHQLGRSSYWVEEELKFEGMVHGADRADFLRLDLSQAALIDDARLDQYNERLNRFAQV